MKIICISGKAQSGKDTTAKIMCSELEHFGSRVLITHYADLLKYICKTFFAWDGQKDHNGRRLLQRIGTDVIRQKDENFFVGFLVKFLAMFEDTWDYVLIPDARFPNEVSMMQERFQTFHVQVERNFKDGLQGELAAHSSETALDDVQPDYTIHNDGTEKDLKAAVICTLKEIVYAEKS